MIAAATHPRLCRADGREAERAAALVEIDRHLDNLRRCIHWLVGKGIAVINCDLRRARHQPWITVAPSPYLYIVFGDDAASVARQQEDAIEIVTWQANRHGWVIRWQEYSA